MKILPKIAWRNISRNKTRSIAILISIILSIWAGTYTIAFVNGLHQQRLSGQLENTLGHFKVVHPNFGPDKNSFYGIHSAQKIIHYLKDQADVKAFSPRVNCYGLALSTSSAYKVDIYGVRPAMEKQVFGLDKKIIQGQYLDQNAQNAVVIGEQLATQLNCKVGSKLALVVQNMRKDEFRQYFYVKGIYQLRNSYYESSHVFVTDSALRALLGVDNKLVHQIVGKVIDIGQVSQFTSQLKIYQQSNINTVLSWDEVAPELAYLEELMRGFFFIFMSIILTACSLGVLNTILVSVLERQQEIALLIALGMGKRSVFIMILWESLFLNSLALLSGLSLAGVSIQVSNYWGIDLSIWDDGLKMLGFDNLIRPQLSLREYAQISLMVLVASVLAVIYPATKATQIQAPEVARKA
ncbi:MAG: ABC transporter permease [Bacteroidia bacterium]|nr:ABC transporter permease [Bacteroidia bacterium]